MEHHAMDVTNAEMQNAIADSLLDTQAEQAEETQESYFGDSIELLNQEIDERSQSHENTDGEGITLRHSRQRQDDQAPPEPEREAEPQEAGAHEQAQPITDPSPAQVKEALESLDTFADKFELNADSRKFADSLEPLLGPEIYKHEALLSNTVSRYTLSALGELTRTNGDLSKFPPLSTPMIQEASRAVATIFGVNVQEEPLADAALTANALRYGLANLIATHYRTGETDVTRLNEKDTAVWFVQNLVKGIWGVTEPVSPKWAVQFANSLASRVLPMLPKISQGVSAQGKHGRTQSNLPRVKGGARNLGRTEFAPKFRTNDDIFSPEIMQTISLQRL